MSLVLDIIMEYIDQALAEAPDEEAREDLRDGIIRRLGQHSRTQRTILRYVATDADDAAGHELTDEELARVEHALPTSTIAEAFADVVFAVAGSDDPETYPEH